MDRSQGNKPAAPPTGWLRSELVGLLRVSSPTISKYIREGLLPPVQFRGAATRYQRIHLLHLLAVRHLRADGVVALKQIKVVLGRLNNEQLEAWILSRPNSPEVLRLLGVVNESANRRGTTPRGHGADAGNARGHGADAGNPRGQRTVLPQTSNTTPPAAGDVSLLPAPDASAPLTARAPFGAASGETSPPVGAHSSGAVATETWQTLELAPGVVLSWRAEEGVVARGLIQRLLSVVARDF